MKNKFPLIILAILSCGILSCNNNNEEEAKVSNTTEAPPVTAPAFNPDTAYRYVAEQVAFGPRTPNSPAQLQCASYMQAHLQQVTDTVYRQEATVIGGDGKKLRCINLIGAINPNATNRILLLTHWDSRPWADEGTVDKDKPVLAADDGASGVGVLLEVATRIKANKLPPNIGIDILLEDVEDYGRDTWGAASYCLGTQYWATHLHVPRYRADFGILLDMVGARNAVFPMEQTSKEYAGEVQQKVYLAARHAGYASFFPYSEPVYNITDDHVFVNKLTNIPTIDIINLNGGNEHVFPLHWHTHSDNMDVIDKSTLKAVGQTLLQTIYEYAAAKQ